VQQRVLDQPVARIGESPDLLAIGPRADAAARRRERFVVRIDAPREDLLQQGVHAGPAESFLDQGVHAEAGQVAFVRHDRIAQRDRARHVHALRQHVEQLGRARPIPAIPVEHRVAVESGRHAGAPGRRSRVDAGA